MYYLLLNKYAYSLKISCMEVCECVFAPPELASAHGVSGEQAVTSVSQILSQFLVKFLRRERKKTSYINITNIPVETSCTIRIQ